DPYSHTPGFAGAQQPGMTGQVKEDIITRRGEMGARVVDGRLCFRGDLCDEWLGADAELSWIDARGRPRTAAVPAGAMASTICQVAVVVHRDGGPRVSVTRVEGSVDGSVDGAAGLTLDRATSAAIFDRTGEIDRVDVFLEGA
ncbi:MAG TPA: hypothetical protein VHE79_13365, partial [Spirochaetia bacterium]